MNERLLAWLLTWTTEFVVYAFWIRGRPFHLLLISILINTLTQPLAVYVYQTWLLSIPGYTGGHVTPILAVIEAGVLIVEWMLVRLFLRTAWLRSFLIAFSANLVTTLMSFVF